MVTEARAEWPDRLEGALIKRSERAIFRAVDDGSGLVLHLDTADYFGLNQVGGVIWDLLGDGTSWEALIGDMKTRFEDPPPSLEQDTAAFLQELHSRDLVELVAHE
jgi:hypothetical protein